MGFSLSTPINMACLLSMWITMACLLSMPINVPCLLSTWINMASSMTLRINVLCSLSMWINVACPLNIRINRACSLCIWINAACSLTTIQGVKDRHLRVPKLFCHAQISFYLKQKIFMCFIFNVNELLYLIILSIDKMRFYEKSYKTERWSCVVNNHVKW